MPTSVIASHLYAGVQWGRNVWEQHWEVFWKCSHTFFVSTTSLFTSVVWRHLLVADTL